MRRHPSDFEPPIAAALLDDVLDHGLSRSRSDVAAFRRRMDDTLRFTVVRIKQAKS
jgi:hypothetical protein